MIKRLLRMFNIQRINIIIEKAGDNYSAYCPDIPGCIATGKSENEVKKNFQTALQMHDKGIKEDNLKIHKHDTK